jgi:glutamyl-tRNA reductase
MIGLIGFDHRRASLELRGRLSFTGEELNGALQALHTKAALTEVAILSTCNRTEIYFAAPVWEPARERVLDFLESVHSARPPRQSSLALAIGDALGTGTVALPAEVSSELADVLYERQDIDVARHLLRVAAGLESMVLGEAQVLGQVKDALTAAETAGTVGEELRAAFVMAIKAGKHVRMETEIGRVDVSVAALAVRVAHEALGGLAGTSALIIGAGKTSQLGAHLLRDAGVGRLLLANRSRGAADDLAREVGGEVVEWSAITQALRDVRLVISATAAPHVVLDAATVAAGLAGSRAPVVMIDLAVPPDIESAVGLLPAVSLYTLDTLRTLDGPSAADAGGRETSRDSLAQAERILADAEREYLRGQTVRKMVPGIAALRRHVDRSEQAELARALAQLAHLSPEDQMVVERFGQRLVDKMFHHLVSRIRSLAEYDEVAPQITMQVLERLFADPDATRLDE